MSVNYQVSVPENTSIADLSSLARNLSCIELKESGCSQNYSLGVEKLANTVVLRSSQHTISFAEGCLASLELWPVTHGTKKFVALVTVFDTSDGASSYRLITSHESETEWLRNVAAKIAALVNRELIDRA